MIRRVRTEAPRATKSLPARRAILLRAPAAPISTNHPGIQSQLQRCFSNARDPCVCLCGAPRGGDPARGRSPSADGESRWRRCPTVGSRGPSADVAAGSADATATAADAAPCAADAAATDERAAARAADATAPNEHAAAEHGAADGSPGTADVAAEPADEHAAAEHGAGDAAPRARRHAGHAAPRRPAQFPAPRHGDEHGSPLIPKRRQPACAATRPNRWRRQPARHGGRRRRRHDAAFPATRKSRWA